MNRIKVLYISSQNPYGNYGGSIGVRRTYLPLMSLHEKNKIELKSIFLCPKELIPDSVPPNVEFITIKKYQKYLTKLEGLADYLELYKARIYKIFLEFGADIVLFDNSKLGNIIEYIKSKSNLNMHNFCVITNFANFELAFAKEIVKYTLPPFLWKYKFKMVENSELKSVKYSDFIMFLTENDRKAVFDHYHLEKKSDILPFYYEEVLTQENYEKMFKNSNVLNIVFTGSLNYSPNIEAALFLMENAKSIQNILQSKFHILIAGHDPNPVLFHKAKDNNLVEIISNPSKEKMSEILFNSDLFISPVFNGSGIKTKIVEALSHGLPIISSEHSFIGYEFLSDYLDNVIFKFEDENVSDFLSKLKSWNDKYKNSSKKEIFNKVRKIYKSFFSFDNVENKLYSILKECDSQK